MQVAPRYTLLSLLTLLTWFTLLTLLYTAKTLTFMPIYIQYTIYKVTTLLESIKFLVFRVDIALCQGPYLLMNCFAKNDDED